MRICFAVDDGPEIEEAFEFYYDTIHDKANEIIINCSKGSAVPTPPPALTLNPLKSESFNGGFPLPINSYCGKFEVIKYIPLNFDASFFNIVIITIASPSVGS